MDDDGAAKSAQAAHVIVIILSDVKISNQELERAKEYFFDEKWFDPGFLPWPVSVDAPLFHLIEDLDD